MLELIGKNGWIMLSAFLEPAPNLKRKAEKYGKAETINFDTGPEIGARTCVERF